MPSKPLPPNTNPAFPADYSSFKYPSFVYPAHPTNYSGGPRPVGIPIKGICLHTPEEEADDTETTPVWFSQDHGDPNKAGSTTYYLDNDGDVYQCVSEGWMHFGNGVVGKPYPAWANKNVNLNWQTISIEIEGRAATIQDTLTPSQWNGLKALIRDRCAVWGIPMDREHIFGHYEVSNQRSDPGALFPWDALIFDLQEEDLTEEQKRQLDDRDGRVQIANLLARHYNLSVNRAANTLTIYDPSSNVVKAVIQDVPEWVPT